MADKYLNKTVLQYFYNRLKTLFATKTEVNDLSDRVDDIVSEGGEPNIINDVKVNNSSLPITNKSVNIDLTSYAQNADIPTNTSDLNNDSGFITNTVNNLTNYYTSANTYTKSEVDSLIGGITGVNFEIVSSLPQTGQAGTIYLVSNSGSAPNIYDEYIYVSNSFEKIGSTDIDLSQYWGKSELTAITTQEIDTIIDGEANG